MIEWKGKSSGGTFLTAGGTQYTLTSECVDGKRATVEVTAVGAGFSLSLEFSVTGSKTTFTDDLNYINPYVFNGEFKTIDITYSTPTDGSKRLGMIAAGWDPEKLATMNNGASCGITGLGDACNESCSGIRGLSIGIGILYGSSTVTNVTWESCK